MKTSIYTVNTDVVKWAELPGGGGTWGGKRARLAISLFVSDSSGGRSFVWYLSLLSLWSIRHCLDSEGRIDSSLNSALSYPILIAVWKLSWRDWARGFSFLFQLGVKVLISLGGDEWKRREEYPLEHQILPVGILIQKIDKPNMFD